MIQHVIDGPTLIAIIISHRFSEPGIHFFTPPEYSQQVGLLHHPQGTTIAAHVHNPVSREVIYSSEVLFIKRGKVRVDFFSESHLYLESRILGANDILFLAKGGHGFEILEETEIMEVRQGPYTGERDKTRFAAVPPDRLKLVEPT